MFEKPTTNNILQFLIILNTFEIKSYADVK